MHALLDLWPAATSYTVSYLFIAVVWLNHRHVFAYANELTNRLALSNFANLFAISLIPFTLLQLRGREGVVSAARQHGWHRAESPPFLSRSMRRYFYWWSSRTSLMREAYRQGLSSSAQKQTRRVHFLRAWIMVAVFAFAAFAVFVPAGVRLALTTTFLALHFRPNLLRVPDPPDTTEDACRG